MRCPVGESVRACSLGDCVEVTSGGGGVELCSTLDPWSCVYLSRSEWDAFVAAVKRGDFDDV